MQTVMPIYTSVNLLLCPVGGNSYSKVAVILFWYHRHRIAPVRWFQYLCLNQDDLLHLSKQLFNVVVSALSWLCPLFSEGQPVFTACTCTLKVTGEFL